MTTQHPITTPSDLTPPTAPGQKAVPAAPRRGRGIAITVAVLGGLIATSAIADAVIGGLRNSGPQEERSYRADATGVTDLDLTVSAAHLDVAFGDVDEAELQTTARGGQSVRDWTIRRDGTRLTIEQDFAFGLFDWFSWGGGEERATLTLPMELAGEIDLVSTTSAGSTIVRGDYRDVALNLSAGHTEFIGDADDIVLGISAGEGFVTTQDASSIAIDVSAGKAVVRAEGAAPSDTSVEVSAGSVELTLPDTVYAVTQDISAGSADIGVRTDRDADASLSVRVSAGDVTVQTGD